MEVLPETKKVNYIQLLQGNIICRLEVIRGHPLSKPNE
jgi:hypothetical protein